MKQVLVVDDDRNIGKLLDFALQQAGFAVLIARNGDEGLMLAAEYHPDVAILDVMMPGMNGYELCRRLRADPQTTHARIIFLTARSQPIDERAALSAGADLFLSKPVLPDELVTHIQTLLLEEKQILSAPPEPEQPVEKEPELAAPPPVKPKGRLIACFSPTPKTGVTALSVNLALGLAVSLRKQVPLVELHKAPSGVLTALGLEADLHRGNLQATGPKVNWDTLLLHLVEHPAGVRILPAPPHESEVPPILTEQAVSLLRTRFPVTVADVEHTLDERVKPVLLAADAILLLTTPDVPAIRLMVQAMQALRKLEYPGRQVLLVVNNVRAQPGVPIERLTEGIKHPIFAVIPHEPTMADTLRAGRPILAVKPKSLTSQAIGRMTMQLVKGFKLA